jgi:hypothetical protein
MTEINIDILNKLDNIINKIDVNKIFINGDYLLKENENICSKLIKIYGI